MPRVFPFEALVYDPEVVGPLDRVTTPPYDVISEARRSAYLAEPHSVIHLDLADGPESGPDNRYDRAASALTRWRGEGVLRSTGEPSYVAYEMRFRLGDRDRRVRGILCAMQLEEWGGLVVPHERTTQGPLEDRLRLLRATRAHLSAVYGLVTGPSRPLSDLLEGTASGPALIEIVDEQDVAHRLWPVPGDAPVADWLADQSLLIADGHHRYTTALAYARERHRCKGAGLWDRILTFVVDAGTEDVPILPFHRIQTRGEPAGIGEPVGDADAAIAAIDDDGPTVAVVTARDHDVAYRVGRLPGEPPAVRALHLAALDAMPAGVLRYTPDLDEAVAAVRSRDAVAAYLLPPTGPDRIRAVIARGERLPEKSTFFWPKPRTGLVLMPLG